MSAEDLFDRMTTLGRQEIQAAYFVSGGCRWGGLVGLLRFPAPLLAP